MTKTHDRTLVQSPRACKQYDPPNSFHTEYTIPLDSYPLPATFRNTYSPAHRNPPEMLNKETRHHLKVQAHPLKPLVQIGRHGLTPAALANIDRALTDHALIKVKFNDHKGHKKELSTTIAEEIQADIVDLIGNTLILHRET